MPLRGFYVFRLRYILITAVFLSLFAFLFGAFYLKNIVDKRTLEIMSWVVSNQKIVIDPGHGGYDSGAVGPGGTLEKDITLAVSKILAEELSRAGALVILTRDSDKDFLTPGPGTKKKRDLDKRLEIVQKNEAEMYINIQANSFGTRWSGPQTFYNPKNELNKKLAEYIQSELKKATGTRREAKKDTTTYMLKSLEIPAVLVEVGFISNPEEENRLKNPLCQKKLAWSIYSGIVKFLAEEGNN